MQTPLRIDFELQGLAAVPDRYPPMLDALLLALKTNGLWLESITPELLPIAVHKSAFNEWHWKASAIQVEYVGPPTARFLFRNARPLEMLEHAADHGASRVYLDRGVTRTVKTRIQLRQAVSAHAWCIGDASLLQPLLKRLTNLGAYRHMGYGQVTGFDLVEDEEAVEKCWLRPISSPSEELDPYSEARITIQGQSIPPYWDRKTGKSFFPINLL